MRKMPMESMVSQVSMVFKMLVVSEIPMAPKCLWCIRRLVSMASLVPIAPGRRMARKVLMSRACCAQSAYGSKGAYGTYAA